MKRFINFTFLLVLAFMSCRFTTGQRIDGNGNRITKSRSVRPFTGVNVSGGIDVFIKQDSVVSVNIETDENLQEFIHITVDDDILEIKEENGYNLQSSKGIKVYVSGITLNHFDASGACDINSQNQINSTDPVSIRLSGACNVNMDLKSPKVKVDLSGAGTVNLKGEAKDFMVDGSGSTLVKCFDLVTENTKLEMSGSGEAEIFAQVKLNINISGAAEVKYKGNATVSQEISGAGTVKKVDTP